MTARVMAKIGEFVYPTRATFTDALQVTDAAVTRFGNLIPYIEATKILGYNIKDPSAIPGYVYKRFDELCYFGLLARDKPNRGLRSTELGRRAFDPDYQTKANEAKAEAVRNVPIVAKAFTDWKGKIPEDNAFPARLADLASVTRLEAENHVTDLKKLISECFPVLQSSGQPSPLRRAEIVQPDFGTGRGEKRLVDAPTSGPGLNEGTDYGELRTTIGSVNITDTVTLGLAKHLLEALETRLAEEKKTPKKGKAKSEKEENE